MTQVPDCHHPAFHHIADDEDLSQRAANYVADVLSKAIATRGTATLLVSGGSSPLPLYKRLSQMDLSWSCVAIGLVDERWVEETSAGSNTHAIRNNLLINKAKTAQFREMTTEHTHPSEALDALEDRFSDWSMPFDLCLLGMGSDSHTASWFPKSEGLHIAMSKENDRKFAAIDAAGCPGAGSFPHRITLTRSAVLSARHLMLFIPGSEKAKVFHANADKDILEAPVNVLRTAGPRLTVFSGRI